MDITYNALHNYRLKHLFNNATKFALLNFILSAIIVSYLHHVAIPYTKTWPWLLAMACVTSLGMALSLASKRSKAKAGLANIHYTFLVINVFITGFLWGYFYWHFFPSIVNFQRLFLLLIIAGVCVGSIIPMATSFICYSAFILPIILLVASKSILASSAEAVTIMVAVTIYCAFLATMFFSNRKVLLKNIKLFITQNELIKELKIYNEKISAISSTDGLTKLANRHRFTERLFADWERAKRTTTPVALLIIDIDYFKLLNDNYGHLAGDSCLKKIAETIEQTILRKTDLAARYGGDELAVILFNTPIKNAERVAQKIKQAIDNLRIENKHSTIGGYVTVSIGVAATIPNLNDDYNILLAHADQALYAAKEQGRNNVKTYSSSASRNLIKS